MFIYTVTCTCTLWCGLSFLDVINIMWTMSYRNSFVIANCIPVVTTSIHCAGSFQYIEWFVSYDAYEPCIINDIIIWNIIIAQLMILCSDTKNGIINFGYMSSMWYGWWTCPINSIMVQRHHHWMFSYQFSKAYVYLFL